MRLKVRIAHLALRRVVLFVTFPLCLFRSNKLADVLTSCAGSAMEANIPSKLDIADDSSSQGLVEYTAKLKYTLVTESRSISGSISEPVATVLEVLGVGVVKGSNLTLGVAVLLHRISHVVFLSREEGHSRHSWGEASCQVSCRKLVSGIQGHFGLKAYDLIPGVQLGESSPFRLIDQVSVSNSRDTRSTRSAHSREDLVRRYGRRSQGLYGLHFDESVVTVPVASVGPLGSCTTICTFTGNVGRLPLRVSHLWHF